MVEKVPRPCVWPSDFGRSRPHHSFFCCSPRPEPTLAEATAAPSAKPEAAVELTFPYQREGETLTQNKRNPKVTITNRGAEPMTPLRVSVAMFVLDPDLDEVQSAAYLNHKSHGRLIFEPELKPGASASASLPGVKDWLQPAAYRVRIEEFTSGDKVVPGFSVIGLVDQTQIRLEHGSLPSSEIAIISNAITVFESRKDAHKILNMNAVLDGVWMATPAPGNNVSLNEDGTLTVE